VSFPYVHDIAHLVTLLEQAGEQIPSQIRDAEQLTRFAVVTRYPGLVEPVTDTQYQEAVTSAELVVRWAELFLA
jgi:HEPN domain-containing protein